MRIEFIVIGVATIFTGLLFLLTDIIFRFSMKRKTALNLERYENHVLVFYILGTIGLWLLLLSIVFMAFKIFKFSPDFLILFGFISGVIASFRSFRFWALSEDIYFKKNSSEKSLRSVGLGCIGIILFPLLGTIIGYTMFLMFR
jgi:hypothetical protein